MFRSSTEWASFWHGLTPWFERRGYALHTPGSKTSIGLSDGFTVPVRDTCQQQHPPFAYTNASAGPEFIYDSHPRERISTIPQQSRSAYRSQTKSLVPVQVPPYVATSNTGRVYAAQDSLGRHVYIKILKKDSEQLRVVELLRRQKETPGVLPIVDVLEYDEEYAFLVMPRWADIPGPSNLLRSHLDIHSSPGGTFKIITDSREAVFHRLEFAIIDFDFSMIIPGNKNGKDRLPSTLAWMQEYSALDVSQGELVYDPFKYDVGVLGVMFCEMLQVSFLRGSLIFFFLRCLCSSTFIV
ncbi:hypothetical protein F5877DRAFT_31938 [Lentinula edodes]|nr:hypothetical protein F5877DRAFT_31938 [Lentinula edodes]